MRIGSMFVAAPSAEAARRFLAEYEIEAMEISLPITPDALPDEVRRNVLDCGRGLPGQVALHEVLPLALAHRQADFRRRLEERIVSDLQLAGEAGIGIFTLHTTCTRTVRSLEAAWKLEDTRWLAQALDHDITDDFAESVRVLVDLLHTLSPIAQASGVTIALENNFRDQKFFGRRLDSLADIRRVLDEAALPNLAVCFDIYKAYSTEDSLPAAVYACAGRIANVHASDIEYLDTAFHHKRRAIGEGRIEWESTLAALAAVGYNGPLILEMMRTSEDVRTSARRLRQTLARLRARGAAAPTVAEAGTGVRQQPRQEG